MATLRSSFMDDFSRDDDFQASLGCFLSGSELLDMDLTVNFDLPTPPPSEDSSPFHSPGPLAPFLDEKTDTSSSIWNSVAFKSLNSIYINSHVPAFKTELTLESEDDFPGTPLSSQSFSPVQARLALSNIPEEYERTISSVHPGLVCENTVAQLSPLKTASVDSEDTDKLYPVAEGIPPMQVFQPAAITAHWPLPASNYATEDSEDDVDVVTVDPIPAILSLKQSFPPYTPLSPLYGIADPKPAMYPEHINKKARIEPTHQHTSNNVTDLQLKRHMHNSLERRRREDLKSSFDALRDVLPNMADSQDKNPK
eukprot:Ihof_evm3s155 gene=Ihof_evmTU3s155